MQINRCDYYDPFEGKLNITEGLVSRNKLRNQGDYC